MVKRTENVPTNTQVLRELERLLASSQFKNSATQARILAFVVRKAIEKEAITETAIGFAIFEHYDPKSHKVRVNASLVRGKIQEYYENEGKQDLVRIELPAGPAYKSEFSYRAEAGAVQAFRQAMAYKERGSAQSINEAIGRFWIATEDFNPSFADAWAERAEAELLWDILDHIFGYKIPEEGVWSAPYCANEALAIDPECWLAHIVLAASHLVAYRWRQAGVVFAKASEMNPEETSASLWYAAYLITVGKAAEALEIAHSRASEDLGNYVNHVILALFLYVTRQYSEASDSVCEIDAIQDENNYQTLLLGLIRMEQQNAFSVDMFNKVSKIDDPMPWFVGIKPDTKVKTERLLGLEVLGLARAGKLPEAKEKLAILRKQYPAKPMQSALGYIAVGSTGRALASLRRAYREGDILINWLHIFPLFDSLRNHPRFQEIVNLVAADGKNSDSE